MYAVEIWDFMLINVDIYVWRKISTEINLIINKKIFVENKKRNKFFFHCQDKHEEK